LLLERPWPSGTTGDLLARIEQDDSLAGNAYLWRRGNTLHRLRPDWVHVVLGSNEVDAAGDPYETAHAPDVTVVGYIYLPTGRQYAPRTFLPGEIAHYSTDPDPVSHFIGRSWLRSVYAEVDTDRQLTEHKAGFLERGATPSFAIKYPAEAFRGEQGGEQAKAVVEEFQRRYEGVGNSWKALHLFNGADPVSIGANFRDLDFRSVQGAGETRICAAARVPASVVGVSEGLAGSALNAGNFGQARRQFGEQFAYPAWRLACEALAPLVNVPADAELWYDTTDVAFLHNDARDAADIISVQASAIRSLVDGGMDADAAVRAVTGGDLSILAGQHTGLVPVQLQAPGTKTPSPTAQDPDNGAP
jgi:phage portal protein BeeE